VLPFLTSEVINAGETCRQIVKHKGTTIQHERTIIDGKSVSSRFYICHDAGPGHPANVTVAYRIHYLCNGKELTKDFSFKLLTPGEGRHVKVCWPFSPDFVPEKIVLAEIVDAQCDR